MDATFPSVINTSLPDSSPMISGPHKYPVSKASPMYRYANWASEKPSNLPRAIFLKASDWPSSAHSLLPAQCVGHAQPWGAPKSPIWPLFSWTIIKDYLLRLILTNKIKSGNQKWKVRTLCWEEFLGGSLWRWTDPHLGTEWTPQWEYDKWRRGQAILGEEESLLVGQAVIGPWQPRAGCHTSFWKCGSEAWDRGYLKMGLGSHLLREEGWNFGAG